MQGWCVQGHGGLYRQQSENTKCSRGICRVAENKKREDKKRKRSEEDKAKAEAKESVATKTSEDKPAAKKAKASSDSKKASDIGPDGTDAAAAQKPSTAGASAEAETPAQVRMRRAIVERPCCCLAEKALQMLPLL